MELMEAVGKTVNVNIATRLMMRSFARLFIMLATEKAYAVAASGNKTKHERQDAFDAIREEFKATFSEEELAAKVGLINKYYHDVEKRLCVVAFLTKASVWMVVKQLRFVLSGAKLVICPDLTDQQSSLVVKRSL